MRLHKTGEQSLLLPSKYSESSGLSIHSPADDDSFNKFSESMASISSRTGIRTGFPTLDRYFEGGLKSERLFTVAARTGTGKTNFAIALAANLCQQGKKVLFFSTEFQYSKIWNRYISTLSDKTGFRRHAFFVCDSFSPRIEQVEEAIKRVMPDVFIFDHINHLGEEREGLGAFMQGCNFLQRKYQSQGVMVAQLNRQADWVENGKRVEPRMSMIKGSGTIEQASSRVLLLSEVRVTPEFNEIIGVLDKNDSGDRGLLQFGLYKNPYIFKELI
jgi:replicative DNA helicase